MGDFLFNNIVYSFFQLDKIVNTLYVNVRYELDSSYSPTYESSPTYLFTVFYSH